MDSKILKAIEESLPAQVSGILQQRLAELEQKESNLKTLTKTHSDLKENHRKLTIKCDDLKYLKEEKASIIKDRAKLEKDLKTHAVNVQVKDLKVQMSNEKVDLMNNLVGLLMKNPKAITMLSTSNLIGNTNYDQQGYKIGEDNSPGSTTIVEKTVSKD